MVAESQNLIESLSSLIVSYRQLLEIIQQEQEALIETELKELAAINLAKEKLVLQIRKLESQWSLAAKKLGEKLQGLESATPSLKELAQKIGGKTGDQFLELHSVLSSLVRKTSEANLKNRTLTQSALAHINGAMSAIAETFKENPTYGKGGKVREEAVGGSGRLFARQV